MSKSSSDFVAGFLFGAFFGAVLALLFAPAPGEELRGQLKEKSIELKGKAEELSQEATRRAEELRARSQELIESQKTRFQEAIDEGRKAAERKKEELLAQLEGRESSVELGEQGGSTAQPDA
ncbi:MAG: YtxH domain-containing protein [Chloroflexi bacterium]|nr:YtxH domain-containing protein [Chloroflexota bacterium]